MLPTPWSVPATRELRCCHLSQLPSWPAPGWALLKAAKEIFQALASFSTCFTLLLTGCFMTFPTQGQATAPGKPLWLKQLFIQCQEKVFSHLRTEKLWTSLQDAPPQLQRAYLALISGCSASHQDQRQLHSDPKLGIVTLPSWRENVFPFLKANKTFLCNLWACSVPWDGGELVNYTFLVFEQTFSLVWKVYEIFTLFFFPPYSFVSVSTLPKGIQG